jgi:hypothetical protein
VETHCLEKIPVVKNASFIVYVEEIPGATFIHMDVFKWTKTVRREFLTTWFSWAKMQTCSLYFMPFIDNKKMAKWAKLCKFELVKHQPCLDGVTRKLYLWRNNHG